MALPLRACTAATTKAALWLACTGAPSPWTATPKTCSSVGKLAYSSSSTAAVESQAAVAVDTAAAGDTAGTIGHAATATGHAAAAGRSRDVAPSNAGIRGEDATGEPAARGYPAAVIAAIRGAAAEASRGSRRPESAAATAKIAVTQGREEEAAAGGAAANGKLRQPEDTSATPHTFPAAAAAPPQQLWKKLAALSAETSRKAATHLRAPCYSITQHQQLRQQKTQPQEEETNAQLPLQFSQQQEKQQRQKYRQQPQEQQQSEQVLHVQEGRKEQTHRRYHLQRQRQSASCLSIARKNAATAAAAAAAAAATATQKKGREAAAGETGAQVRTADAVGVRVAAAVAAAAVENAKASNSSNWQEENSNVSLIFPSLRAARSRRRSSEETPAAAARPAADGSAEGADASTEEASAPAAAAQLSQHQASNKACSQQQQQQQRHLKKQQRREKQESERQRPQQRRIRQQHEDTSIVKWRGRGGSRSNEIAAQVKKELRLLSLLQDVPACEQSLEQQQLTTLLKQRHKEAAASGEEVEGRRRWKKVQLPVPYPPLLRGLAACSQLNSALKKLSRQALQDSSNPSSSSGNNNRISSSSHSSSSSTESSCSDNSSKKNNECASVIVRDAILDVFYHLPRFPTAHVVRLLRLLALIPRLQLLQRPQQHVQQQQQESQYQQQCSTWQQQQQQRECVSKRLLQLCLVQRRQKVREVDLQQEALQQQQNDAQRLPFLTHEQQQEVQERPVRLEQQQEAFQQRKQQTVISQHQQFQLQPQWQQQEKASVREVQIQYCGKQQLHQERPRYQRREGIQLQLPQQNTCDNRGLLLPVTLQGFQKFLQDPLLLRGDILLVLRLRLLLFLIKRVSAAWLRWFSIEELACFVDACASITASSRDISSCSSKSQREGSYCDPRSSGENDDSYSSRNFADEAMTAAARVEELQQKVEQLLQQVQQQIPSVLQNLLNELPWKTDEDTRIQHLAMLARGFGRLGAPDTRLFTLIKPRLLWLLAAKQQPTHQQPQHQQQQLQHEHWQLQYQPQQQPPEQHQWQEVQHAPPARQDEQQEEDRRKEHTMQTQGQINGTGNTDKPAIQAAPVSSSCTLHMYGPDNSTRSSSCSKNRRDRISQWRSNTNRLLEPSLASVTSELNALACICGEAVRYRYLYDTAFAAAVVDGLVVLLAQLQQQQWQTAAGQLGEPDERKEQRPDSYSRKQELQVHREQGGQQRQQQTKCWSEELEECEHQVKIRRCGREEELLRWEHEEEQQKQGSDYCHIPARKINQHVIEARYVPKLCLWLVSQFSAMQEVEQQQAWLLLLQRSTHMPQQQEQKQQQHEQWTPDPRSSDRVPKETEYQQRKHVRYNEAVTTGSGHYSWLSSQKRFSLAQLLHAPAAAALSQLDNMHALLPILHFLIVFSGVTDVSFDVAATRESAAAAHVAATGAAAVTPRATAAALAGVVTAAAARAEAIDVAAPSGGTPAKGGVYALEAPEKVAPQLLLQQAYLQRLLFLMLPRTAAATEDCTSVAGPGNIATAVTDASAAAATSLPDSRNSSAALPHGCTAAAARSSIATAAKYTSVWTAAGESRRSSSCCGSIAMRAVRSLSFLLHDAAEAHACICTAFLSSLHVDASVHKNAAMTKALRGQTQQQLQRDLKLRFPYDFGDFFSTHVLSRPAAREIAGVGDVSADGSPNVDRPAARIRDAVDARVQSEARFISRTTVFANVDNARSAAGGGGVTDIASAADEATVLAYPSECTLTGQATTPAAGAGSRVAAGVNRAVGPPAASRTAGAVTGAAALAPEAATAHSSSATCIETAFHCVLLELLVLQHMQKAVPLQPRNVQYLYPCMLRAACALSSVFSIPCLPSLAQHTAPASKGETRVAASHRRLNTLLAAVAPTPGSSASRYSSKTAACMGTGTSTVVEERLAANAKERFAPTAAASVSIHGAADANVSPERATSLAHVAVPSGGAPTETAVAVLTERLIAARQVATVSFSWGSQRLRQAPASAPGQRNKPGGVGSPVAAAADQRGCGTVEPSCATAAAAMDSVSTEEKRGFFLTAAAAGRLLLKVACADAHLTELLLRCGIQLPPVSLCHQQLTGQQRMQKRDQQQHCRLPQEQMVQQHELGEPLQQQDQVHQQEFYSQHFEADDYNYSRGSMNVLNVYLHIRFFHAIQRQLLLPVIAYLCCPARVQLYRTVVRSTMQRHSLRHAAAELIVNCQQMAYCASNLDQPFRSSGEGTSICSTGHSARRVSNTNGAKLVEHSSERDDARSRRSSRDEKGRTCGRSNNFFNAAHSGSVDREDSEQSMHLGGSFSVRNAKQNTFSAINSKKVCGPGVVDGKISWQQQLKQLQKDLIRLSESLS